MPIDLASIAAAVATSKTLLAAFTKAGDNERAGQLITVMSALNDAREEIAALKDRISRAARKVIEKEISRKYVERIARASSH